VALDTTKMANGWREIRIRGTLKTPDGKRFLNSSGIPLHVQNGSSSGSDYNRWCGNKSLIGRGWYDGFDYTNAVILCVPQTPVSGTFNLLARVQQNSGHMLVVLDRSHGVPAVGPWPDEMMKPGTVLFDKDGYYSSPVSIPIDTTKLANGWHTVSVQSTNPSGATSACSYCRGEVNHANGVAKIWFYVNNGG
jgi:hypothetical protein